MDPNLVLLIAVFAAAWLASSTALLFFRLRGTNSRDRVLTFAFATVGAFLGGGCAYIMLNSMAEDYAKKRTQALLESTCNELTGDLRLYESLRPLVDGSQTSEQFDWVFTFRHNAERTEKLVAAVAANLHLQQTCPIGYAQLCVAIHDIGMLADRTLSSDITPDVRAQNMNTYIQHIRETRVLLKRIDDFYDGRIEEAHLRYLPQL